ncbi:VOC family protein [Porphyrobacter sp. YT40]|uniref:VOC family protein n=1 Tax=Porphyrobacter sp. YT40 TaxID=2547601 RepID=UPI0011437438|nr:VOC family protein [Porphyrobacter sp. YT40]QDH33786.1 VOC family protein [Porphyrobacter sp. YT40]
MGLSGKIASLGEVMQLAFVPEDFDAAVRHWTEVMGVGPFFLIEGIHLDGMKYRGQPTEAVFDLALAYWGEMQIELIRPRDDHPSIYTGEYARVGNGLHHVCILVDDIAEARRVCAEAGAEVMIEGTFGTSEVIYVDPGAKNGGGGPGTLVEILQQANDGPDLFGMIKAAGVGWDGSEPLRRLG